MKLVKPANSDILEGGVTKEDEERFFAVTTTDLTSEQINRIVNPEKVYRRQENVLAVHWHPEFIPLDYIAKRIETLFPDKKDELIIPTQHNMLMDFNGYSGVEVDCYSRGFNRKVQLLLHFESQKITDATILKNILKHTFKYRSSQLFDFIHAITKPVLSKVERAASETGTSKDIISFVTSHVKKIEEMLDVYYDKIPDISIKNKLLRNYFDMLRKEMGDEFIDRVQFFLRAIKKSVKRDFSLKYFYRTSEVIEEARALGAGIVIPHPEQFWPILLAEYDVDGYEIWNPQSREYTEFLISVVQKKNNSICGSSNLLVFMGDDTHFGEKIKPIEEQKKLKAAREVGVQPPWDDLGIRKELIKANMSRKQVIEEYRERLAS